MKHEYKYSTIARETAEKYKYPSFAMKTAFKYKYQIATKTIEQNTSKQVSAKETTLRNVYNYSRIQFFLKQSECGETESRKWNGGNLGS